MRKFRFRLESVLGLRSHELESRRHDLAQAQAEALQAQARARGARSAAEAGAEQLRARVAEGLLSAELRAVQLGAAELFAGAGREERMAREAAARVGVARGRVLEARTRVRALEILRERALAAHRIELGRQEQAELDEIAGQLWARRALVSRGRAAPEREAAR